MFYSEEIRNKRLTPIWICVALAIITLIAFGPVKDCGFVNFDDGLYVYGNAYVQSGLNWDNVKQAFSSALVKKSVNWHPLTWLSLMLDFQLFGLNPLAYHLINLLLHMISTILLFLVFRRMTKSVWPSAFIAALFAIHPLHVESVAWIASRKDVLSTFFWMLTMGAYSYYVEHPGIRRYVFVLLFLMLGLMAKPMLVTLPFVLLLLDYWPLNRFQKMKAGLQAKSADLKTAVSDKQKKKSRKPSAIQKTLATSEPTDSDIKWSLIFPLLREKIPLFALIMFSSIITYIAQQQGGAVQSVDAYPLTSRIGNAFISYVTYIGKTIWPAGLAVFYPYPDVLIPWQVLGALLLLIAITLGVIWMSRRYPYLATGWFWYAGTMVPVIGVVQVAGQAMADRYTYIPLIGLFIIAAWGVLDLLKKWQYRKEILFIASAAIVLGFSMVTFRQVGYWQNSITLFSHTLSVTGNNYIAHHNRGVAYAELGNYAQAIEDFSIAIKIKPGYAQAYHNRGSAYGKLGNYQQAIADSKKAIDIRPIYPDAYYSRGNAYHGLGNYTQAIADYGRAIDMKPDYADAYFNRGNTYKDLGNPGRAIEDYSRVIGIKPDYAEAYYNRGVIHSILGNYRKAIEDYNRGIDMKPDYAEAYYNRGIAHAGLGHSQQAIGDYSNAIEIKPSYADAYINRGAIHAGLGRHQQAIADYGKAIDIRPDYAEAYANRGISYGMLGSNKKAIADLKTAAKLGSERAKEFLKRQKIN